MKVAGRRDQTLNLSLRKRCTNCLHFSLSHEKCETLYVELFFFYDFSRNFLARTKDQVTEFPTIGKLFCKRWGVIVCKVYVIVETVIRTSRVNALCLDWSGTDRIRCISTASSYHDSIVSREFTICEFVSEESASSNESVAYVVR